MNKMHVKLVFKVVKTENEYLKIVFVLSKLYDVPLVLYNHLRQCLALRALVEERLLFDIGWFVFFTNLYIRDFRRKICRNTSRDNVGNKIDKLADTITSMLTSISVEFDSRAESLHKLFRIWRLWWILRWRQRFECWWKRVIIIKTTDNSHASGENNSLQLIEEKRWRKMFLVRKIR